LQSKRTLTDKRLSQKYRQGTSTRENCPKDILIELLNKEQGFKQLVDKFNGKYARGTVSKYLKELVKDNMISYKNVNVEFGKLERPYCLTKAGLEEAKIQGFVKTLQSLPDQLKTQFILNYKDYVMNKVKNSLFYPYSPARLNQAKFPVLAPDYQRERFKLMREWTKVRPNNEIEKLSQALETDLVNHGFTDEEILKLWILGNGFFMSRAVKAYGAPTFFNALPFKFPPIILSLNAELNNPEIFKKIIKEALQNFNAVDIKELTNMNDLFP
jgi:hypothetical protein